MRRVVIAILVGAALGLGASTTAAQTKTTTKPKPAAQKATPTAQQAPPATQQTPPAAKQTPPPAAAQPAKPFPEGSKVAYINPPRILAESAFGKALAARVNDFRTQKLAELNAKGKELEIAQQKLASGTLLTQDASAAAQKAIDRLQLEIQRMRQDADASLQELQQQLNGEFNRTLAPLVERSALDHGLQMLLRSDTGGVVWADPALDLTSDVIKRLDAVKPPAVSKPPTDAK